MVRRMSLGLCTVVTSWLRKPGGTVIVATTLPEASSRFASLGLSRTSVTSFATWSITVWMWKRWPPTATTGGMPSSSTNATRGFELA